MGIYLCYIFLFDLANIFVRSFQLLTKLQIVNSVVSNIELLDVCSFPLGKVCVRARSKFENVIFCSNQSQILGNTRRTFNVYLMKMFEYVRISNAR